jgi:hypothetical protein
MKFRHIKQWLAKPSLMEVIELLKVIFLSIRSGEYSGVREKCVHTLAPPAGLVMVQKGVTHRRIN